MNSSEEGRSPIFEVRKSEFTREDKINTTQNGFLKRRCLMLVLIRTIAGIAGVVLTLMLSAAIVIWVGLALLPQQVSREFASNSFRYLNINYFPESEQRPLDSQNASIDRRKISARITACADVSSRDQLPEYAKFLLDAPFPYTDQNSNAPQIKPIGMISLRAAQISNDITYAVDSLQRDADSNYEFFQNSTFLTIFIGLLTTVVVSVSSSKIFAQNTKIDISIRILAIFMPVLGTAFAAVIAFYNPNERYINAKQAISGLSQIHREIALDVYRVPCFSNELDGSIAAKMDGWETQFSNLINSTAAKELTQNKQVGSPAVTDRQEQQSKQ